MAIFAMLLLSSGMAHAQDAVPDTTVAPAPTIVIPSIAPTAPATPTIVVPETTSATPSAERATAEPETSAVPARAVSRQTRIVPATAAANASNDRTPVTAPPKQTVATDPAVAPLPAQSPSEPVAATPPQAAVENASADSDAADWAIPVGAAATLLVLGGVAFAATRRRRVWEADADFVPPVVERPGMRPAVERRVVAARDVATPSTYANPVYADSAAATTADERAQLIDRMVASPPDARNPFTSAKARRRRARLIVQSMGREARTPVSSPAAPIADRPLRDHRVLAAY